MPIRAVSLAASFSPGIAMRLFALLVLPLLFATAARAALFDAYEVATPAAKHQTLLVGSFVGDRPQLALATVQPTGERLLRLFALDGATWGPTHEVPLPKKVYYVDVARIAGRDRVVTYQPGAFHWFDPVDASSHRMVELTTRYRAPAEAGVPQLDVARDLNGDGLDDLVVPDLDGFWVATQKPDGSFTAPSKLGPAEPFLDARAYGDERTYGEVGITAQNTPWHLGRVHQLDFDRDGRPDLAFWDTNRFRLHRQGADGTFGTSFDTFTTEVAFDFDGAYGLAFQFGDASVPALLFGFRRRTEHRILHDLADMNADGVVDLMILTLTGRSPLRLKGRYEVHFGRPVPGGTTFPPVPDSVAEAPGRSGGLMPWGYAAQHSLDFDGDGDVDIAMAAVRTSLVGMVSAMAANSITLDLALYRLQDGRYPAKPDVVKRVGSPFAPLDKRGPLFPTVLVGDIDGDGRSDLVTGQRWDELRVFLGQAGPGLLATEPLTFPVEIPSHEQNARLADLDGDGKQDVVIAHPSADEAGRLTILMAR